jgi:hypothetical protein
MIEPLFRNSLLADPLRSNYERDNREYELLGLNSVRIGGLSLRHCLIDGPLEVRKDKSLVYSDYTTP